MPSLDPILLGTKTATITKHAWKRVCAGCYGLCDTTIQFTPISRPILICRDCLGETKGGA